MKKIIGVISILLIMFCLTGCGDPMSPNYGMTSDSVSNSGSGFMESDSGVSMGPSVDIAKDESAYIITTAWYDIETKTYDKAKESLIKLVQESGGYFADSEESAGYNYETNRRDGNRTGRWEIRLPSEKFNAFEESIDSLMTVVRKSVSNEDVTDQYFETANYIDVYEAERERILALMEQATQVSDLIVLEDKLTDLNYKIDGLKGNLKYLDDRISYATIVISIEETNEISVLQSKNFAERFAEQAINGLGNIRKIGEDILLWFAYNLVGIFILMVWITIINVVAKMGFGLGTEVNLVMVLLSIPLMWMIDLGVLGIIVGLLEIIFYAIWKAAGRTKKPAKKTSDKTETKPTTENK